MNISVNGDFMEKNHPKNSMIPMDNDEIAMDNTNSRTSEKFARLGHFAEEVLARHLSGYKVVPPQ